MCPPPSLVERSCRGVCTCSSPPGGRLFSSGDVTPRGLPVPSLRCPRPEEGASRLAPALSPRVHPFPEGGAFSGLPARESHPPPQPLLRLSVVRRRHTAESHQPHQAALVTICAASCRPYRSSSRWHSQRQHSPFHRLSSQSRPPSSSASWRSRLGVVYALHNPQRLSDSGCHRASPVLRRASPGRGARPLQVGMGWWRGDASTWSPLRGTGG